MCFLCSCLRVTLLPVNVSLPQVQVLQNTTIFCARLTRPDSAMLGNETC